MCNSNGRSDPLPVPAHEFIRKESIISDVTVLSRDQHNISRNNISESALKVLYRLNKAGYEACLVGGCVRDLMLGREPKDFDVATNALPEEVRSLFRNCRLIGRRFRLAHILFGREIIEVATFRASAPADEDDDRRVEDGLIVRDNVYGTVEEDAWRRDFRVNALYYNIKDFSVIDYTGGLDDLKSGILHIIGDPDVRFQEDPVRMLRAIRFVVKLGFRLDAQTEDAIRNHAHYLRKVPAARLFDEMSKLFLSGMAVQTFESLRHYHLFEQLFPWTDEILGEDTEDHTHRLLSEGLRNTDQRVAEGKPVTPAFLLAVLLWEAMKTRVDQLQADGSSVAEAFTRGTRDILQMQGEVITIPRRFSMQVREIWSMQHRLARQNKRAMALVHHPRFRAAYDFLLLRNQSGEKELEELCKWWTEFQEQDDNVREGMLSREPRRRRRSRSRRRKSSPES